MRQKALQLLLDFRSDMQDIADEFYNSNYL